METSERAVDYHPSAEQLATEITERWYLSLLLWAAGQYRAQADYTTIRQLVEAALLEVLRDYRAGGEQPLIWEDWKTRITTYIESYFRDGRDQLPPGLRKTI